MAAFVALLAPGHVVASKCGGQREHLTIEIESVVIDGVPSADVGEYKKWKVRLEAIPRDETLLLIGNEILDPPLAGRSYTEQYSR